MASIQASHTGHTVISKITKIKTTTFYGPSVENPDPICCLMTKPGASSSLLWAINTASGGSRHRCVEHKVWRPPTRVTTGTWQ